MAFQPPKLLISLISPGWSFSPFGSVVTFPSLSNRRLSPSVSIFLKYERSLFWKSSGIFWIIFHISSTVASSPGFLNVKWALGSSAPSSPSLGTFTPGWSFCTVSPLRFRSTTVSFLFTVVSVELLEVSSDVPFVEPSEGVSPTSLLVRRLLVGIVSEVDEELLDADSFLE